LKLAYLGGNVEVKPVFAGGNDGNFPHYTSDQEPACPTTVVAGASENDALGLKYATSGDIPAARSCPAAAAPQINGGGCSLGNGEFAASVFVQFLILPGLMIWRKRKLKN